MDVTKLLNMRNKKTAPFANRFSLKSRSKGIDSPVTPPLLVNGEETKPELQVRARMSTRYSDVKSNCKRREVLTERPTSDEKERPGASSGFQEAWRENPSNELVQTTKNLCIRRRILLKGKDDRINPPENLIDSRSQLCFTSVYSVGLERNRTQNHCTEQRSNNELQTQSDAPRRANVQHLEVFTKTTLPNSLKESTPEDEDGSNPQDSATKPSWKIHPGDHVLEGIQRRLGTWDQTQSAAKCTHGQFGRSDHQRKSEVHNTPEQNAEGSSHADSRFSTCFPTAINHVLSSPAFPAFDPSNKPETEADLISSTTAAMFTSTLVSVLAPHWSGKFRRHKQGLSDAEPDIQASGQNKNLAGSTQSIRQKAFLLNHTAQPHGEWKDGFNNKSTGTPSTGRNFAKWQKDISENIQSNRPLLKASSLSPNNQTADMTEFGEEPKVSHSLQLNDYRRISQPDQAKFQSLRSRPTTSTLLLSSRRLNSQKANAQPLQMNKQLSASVSSLNLPSKGLLKHSSPFSPLLPSKDLTKESSVLSSSLEQLSCAERSTIGRDPEAPRKQLFTRNSEYDISTKAFQPTTRERLYSSDGSSKSPHVPNKDMLLSNSLRFNQPEAHKYFQRQQREFLTRQDSHVENSGTFGQASTDQENLYSSTNFNVRSPPSAANWNSPKEIINPRFFFPQDLSNRSPVSPNYLSSDFTTSRHNSQSSTTSPNINISGGSLNQSLSPLVSNSNYTLNSEKTNTVYSTTSYTSLSSPKPVQSLPHSPSGLTVVSPTQPTQSHIQNPSSASSPVSSFRTRNFTDRLSISPKKESFVDETSPTHKWHYLNSRRLSESTQSPVEQTVPQSPADFKLRRPCTSSIYSYLRETSSPKTTDTPSPFSSSSPLTPSLNQDKSRFSKEDRNTGNLRFSFDFSPTGSQDGDFKHSPSTSGAPQSLPADSNARSVTRLSKSPYSTLISARQRLSSSSSPSPSSLNGSYHKRSISFDSSVIINDSPKDENKCNPTNKYQIIYRTTEEPVGSGNLHSVARTLGTPTFLNSSSRSLNISSEDSPDSQLPDYRTTSLVTNTTLSKQSDGYVKITPHKKLNKVFTSYRYKGNTSPTDVANPKKVSSPPSTATITEAMLEEVKHDLYSKKDFLSLNKKDNLPSTDKEDSGSKKAESTGFKTTKKVDQMIYRLKMTFGVKLPDADCPTVKKKTKNQEPSDIKPPESNKKEQDRLSGRQTFKSTKSTSSQMISKRESSKPLDSSESKLERQNNLLNLNVKDHENRNSFQGGRQSSESTEKDGRSRVESPTLKSQKIPNPQITAVKESDLSFGPVSQSQPIKQENKPFDVNLGKQLTLLKPDSPTLTHTVSSNPPISSIKESSNSPGPVSGFRLERQEALTNVDTNKTLDEWISCKKSSSDWEKAESTRKEEERLFDTPSVQSQKSSGPQFKSLREAINSSGPTSGFKLDWEKAKGTGKEEERLFDTPTFKTRRSPSPQIISMRESDNSTSSRSGLKSERQKNSPNVDDFRLQSSNLAMSESFRKEEDLKIYILKSPDSPTPFKSKFETPTVSVSGHKSETQESSPKQLEKRKRGVSSPLSPSFQTPDLRERSVTLPLGRKSSLSPSPTAHPFDALLEDVQNDNVFQSPKLRKKSHADTKDFPNLDTDVNHGRTTSTGPDLMYGLQRSRSVSVSSVVSGRPSGPGRISTGSKHGSISDLSNLDGTRSRHSSISSPIGSPDHANMKSKGSTGQSPSDRGIFSPASLCSWEAERDPTPPPSPGFSRRMSQVSCSSPDGLTPRRFLATKSSAHDESGSDTTTDDEYYLNSDDDEQETEL